MANLTKAQRLADKLARRERRQAAATEIRQAKVRVLLGFGGTYVVTQVLPSFAPGIADKQAIIDLLLAGGGGFLAFTREDELGDAALGASLVGLIQTFDNIGAKLREWFPQAA